MTDQRNRKWTNICLERLYRVLNHLCVLGIDTMDKSRWVSRCIKDCSEGLFRRRFSFEEEPGYSRVVGGEIGKANRRGCSLIQPGTEWMQGIESIMLDDGDRFQQGRN